MTFTYSSSTQVSSSLGYVRLLIGDTDSTSPIFQDEEINAIVAIEENYFMAAGRLMLSASNKVTAGGLASTRKVGETMLGFRSASEMKIAAQALFDRGRDYQAPLIQYTSSYSSDSTKPRIKLGDMDY